LSDIGNIPSPEHLVIINLDYSRTEANPPHPNNNVEEVAHEVWAVRSVRPKGKKCRLQMIIA
jgi:hypothetical protein